MKIMHKTVAAGAVAFATLMFTTGCDTPGEGAAVGGTTGFFAGTIIGDATGHPELGQAIGTLSGLAAGAVIGEINEEQQRKLEANSPRTLRRIRHNDDVVQEQRKVAKAHTEKSTSSETASSEKAPSPTPLSVDDVKALTAAGVKKDAIIHAMKESKAVYHESDVAKAQGATPPVDPDVISYMQKTT